MVDFYLFNPIIHLQPIRKWARKSMFEVKLDPISFLLELSCATRSIPLYPRFLIRVDAETTAYTHTFTDECRFVGWLPYRAKQWPIATDKIIFKRYCEREGLRVAKSWREGPPLTENYILKPRNGSFGKGIRGPFRNSDWLQIQTELTPDLFFEEFVAGQPVKAWFWNSTPVAIESIASPFLLADGKRTLAEIVTSVRGSFDKPYQLDEANEILRWQGLTANSVPTAGEKIQLAFLYASIFDSPHSRPIDLLPDMDQKVRKQFLHAGVSLGRAIPEQIAHNTISTVDAVIDETGSVCVLEVNCNPVVHPKTYDHMLEDIERDVANGIPIP